MIGDNMSMAHLKNVYFQRSNGEFMLIWENCSQEDVMLIINDFLRRHNYTSYYTRTWEKSGVKWYDVGSWTEFFVWAREEDIERLKNERTGNCQASQEEE